MPKVSKLPKMTKIEESLRSVYLNKIDGTPKF